ncbi:MAG: outer membrane protein assembly factor [Alphaproteobacteria bacterium]|nr:MAG: outer membrane protein assembly factor [Alphaproteobacteria bacterium]
MIRLPVTPLLLAIGALSLATGNIAAAQDAPRETVPSGTIPYQVEITGADPDLQVLLLRHSGLKRSEADPPRFYGALRARIDEDRAELMRLLRSEGYYDAQIAFDIDATHRPLRVILRVTSGTRYRVAEVETVFEGPPPDDAVLRALRDSLSLHPGDPARAADILAAEKRILDRLPELGHPLAEMRPREVVIDHATGSASVRYHIAGGPQLLFGAVSFTGAEDVDRGYLARLIPWTEGSPYDRRLVDAYRRTLIGTRLFSAVAIDFAQPAATLRQEAAPVVADLRVTLSPARLRTIAVSAGFSTSEGVGGDVSWEHRNLFGAGERLTLTLTGAEIEQSLVADFRKPHFRRRGQTLTAGAGLVRESSDAFDSLEFRSRLGLERHVGERWTLTGQGELTVSNVDDLQGSRTFLLAALPLAVAWDSRDDLLDPRRGGYVRLGVTPHLALQDSLFSFLKSELQASAYEGLLGESVILAQRLRLGSVSGAERNRLPANRRFFAGGGGSIRGFGFRNVGPLDANGDPLGGRSLLEMSFEMRTRLGKRFGIVPFVDGGEVWEQAVPQFDRLRWSAGLGLRYFTDFAPIRIDVAFPLNRRPGEDRLQFYISLGQSF